MKSEWQEARVGDILKVRNGFAVRSADFSTEGIPLIRQSDIKDGVIDISEAKRVPARVAEDCGEYLVRKGDLLIGMSGSLGKIGRYEEEEPAVQNQRTGLLQLKSGFSAKFAKLVLQFVEAQIIAEGKGVAVQNVSAKEIENCTFPLPPEDERDKIVAEVEKQFTRLDAGVASLKRVQVALKRYRASVLKAACEGHLVPTEAELARKENRSYETGSELLQRILKERREKWNGKGKYKEPAPPDVFGLPRLPQGWTYVTIETVGSVQLGRQRAPQHHKGDNMRPYLRVANVFEDRLDLSDIMEMNFTPKEFETFQLKPNDILLNEGQSLELVGRPAIYKGELPGACFTNTLVRFRADVSLNVRFALVIFRAFMHSGRFQKVAKWTTNIAHLGSDRFAKMAFSIPPLAEQMRIVAEVERRLSVIDELEAVVSANLQRASRLRHSVLDSFFARPFQSHDQR